MFDESEQSSNKTGSISVITSSSATRVLTRGAIRRKREKRGKRIAFLKSLFSHLVLFFILLFVLPQITPLKLRLINAAKVITIFNLFPEKKAFFPIEKQFLPVEKPSVSEKKPSVPEEKPSSFIPDSKREIPQNYRMRNVPMPKIDYNILALREVVIPQTDKWEKKTDAKRQDHRRTALTKKIAYQQRSSYEATEMAFRKKIFYEDKTNDLSRKDETEVIITVNLPVENKATDRRFVLSGRVRPNVESAILTINDDNAKILRLYSEEYFVTVATLSKGLNKFTIVVLTHEGKMGVKTFQLLYQPPLNAPVIVLYSPENGQQGVKAGDTILVEGLISDQNIKTATLYLNKTPINLMVTNGEFKTEVQAPNNKITTLQVRALGKKGVYGYSAQHTVLTGYGYEIPVMHGKNPRPY